MELKLKVQQVVSNEHNTTITFVSLAQPQINVNINVPVDTEVGEGYKPKQVVTLTIK